MKATLISLFATLVLLTSHTSIFSQPFIKAGGPFEILEASSSPQYLQNNSHIVDFIEQKLVYPRQALRMGIQGIVPITFSVNNDGTVSEITVTRDIRAGCGESLAKVINQTSGLWNFENEEVENHTIVMWASFNFMYGQTHKSVERMKSKGLEFFEQEKFKNAISQFDNYLQNYTYDPEILLKRAEAYQKIGKNDLACKDLGLLRLMGELGDNNMIKTVCGY